MRYHLLRTDDMLNGDGLRIVLFVSGCDNKCKGCHNPETWDINGGKEFTKIELNKIFEELSKDYISGITISGGDPLKYENLPDVYDLVCEIKSRFPEKTIWLYTGFELSIGDFDTSADVGWDNGLLRNHILKKCDIVCDGKFVEQYADVNTPWVGSTNQRVIDVQQTLAANKIITQ